MFNQKEIGLLLGVTVILAAALSFLKGLDYLLYALVSVFIILLVNSLAKKMASTKYDSEITLELWKMQRYGFSPGKRFKHGFPAGILMPLIFSGITLGRVAWLASLVFDVRPKTYRAARRHGLYKFSEMTEDHMGYIAAWGIAANLAFALIGYLIGFEEFSRLSIYYTFFNMLPFSDLDGNKIFFGNLVLWGFLASVVLVALGLALIII